MLVPKASSTAQFATIVTLLWYWITVSICNHYINIKILHKIQIFLLPLTSLYTVVMVSQMPRRPRNVMQTNRFQKEQSLTNFQGSISNFLGIHRKKQFLASHFTLMSSTACETGILFIAASRRSCSTSSLCCCKAVFIWNTKKMMNKLWIYLFWCQNSKPLSRGRSELQTWYVGSQELTLDENKRQLLTLTCQILNCASNHFNFWNYFPLSTY